MAGCWANKQRSPEGIGEKRSGRSSNLEPSQTDVTKAQTRDPGNEFERRWKQGWGGGREREGVRGNVHAEDNTDICVRLFFKT